MSELSILSPSQQVAEYLRRELLQEKWLGLMPGSPQLSEELGADRKTIEAALRLLEEDGWLVAQGVGRKRKITLPAHRPPTSLRIAILVSEDADRKEEYVVNLFHALNEAGHTAFYTSRYLTDMGMNVRKIERLVRQTKADAWVVIAASREVLSWFAEQSMPVFAMFGRRAGLAVAAAGPDKVPVLIEATRKLIGLGHKRIVMMVRARRRIPTPAKAERFFLAELAAHNLPVSDYNLPSWDESMTGYYARLRSLFASSPPTALIVDEIPHLIGTMQFLARNNVRVPEDVSILCTDYDSSFDWCDPAIAHIRWDSRPVIRRIIRWAVNISSGKKDTRQILTPAEFVAGGTIAVAPRV